MNARARLWGPQDRSLRPRVSAAPVLTHTHPFPVLSGGGFRRLSASACGVSVLMAVRASRSKRGMFLSHNTTHTRPLVTQEAQFIKRFGGRYTAKSVT